MIETSGARCSRTTRGLCCGSAHLLLRRKTPGRFDKNERNTNE